MRLHLAALALTLAACDSTSTSQLDAGPDAILCEPATRVCIADGTTPSVGATVTASANGEIPFEATTDDNGCAILDLPLGTSWTIEADTVSLCSVAPTFYTVTQCDVRTLDLTVDVDTCRDGT